jgi:hypothetical protein
MWRGEFARVLDDGIDRAFAQREEIVRLPVIAGTACEERVESLLPCDIRLDTEVLA